MEAATASVGGEKGTGSATVADLLPRAVEKYGDAPAVKFKDGGGTWITRSFADVGETVRRLALGLIDLGVQPGDRVSILANTRPEWTYADFAALTAGATVVPIYQTNSPEECQYVLDNSDAKVVDGRGCRAAREGRGDPRAAAGARARRDHGGRGRGRDLLRAARRPRRRPRRGRVASPLRGRQRRGRLHVHLHVGDDRAAEGLRDQPRQLPGDARHDGQGDRARARADRLPVPPPRALLRAADPARQLRHRRRHRLLGARPAEDRPEPLRGPPALLPLGAADLREDLHDGDERDRQGGRHPASGSSGGRSASARRCARWSAPAASRASCCSASTRSPTSRC